MPEGPLGFQRLTDIGPLVEDDDTVEWKEMMEESDRRLREYGFDT